MTDPATIAASLTKAQTKWLQEAWYGPRGWRIVGYRKKACDLGLCDPGSSRLSPVGLAVMAHLEKSNAK